VHYQTRKLGLVGVKNWRPEIKDMALGEENIESEGDYACHSLLGQL
jgi:hypothetical protein